MKRRIYVCREGSSGSCLLYEIFGAKWGKACEIDLRKTTDLTNVLAELDCPWRSSKSVIYPCSDVLRPKIFLFHRANTRSLGLCCMVLVAVRHDSPIRPESNLEWIILNAFTVRLAARSVCWVGPSRLGYLCESFIKDEKI